MSKWETAEEIARRLVPNADPNRDADCLQVGAMVIAIRARDAQVRDRLAAALESEEPFAACRALLADLGGEVSHGKEPYPPASPEFCTSCCGASGYNAGPGERCAACVTRGRT